MAAQIAPWAYVLAVHDIDRSAAYFRDVLGFAVQWEGATDWRLVERDGVRVMLGACPHDAPASELGSHNWFGYIDTTDIAQLYSELIARGAICSEPADRHYGMREVVVTTIDGHRIVFGQAISAANSN